jgi:hypothetical protein
MFAEKTRQTKTRIFFWAVPLSNWYKGQTYSGARALDLTIDRLDRIDIKIPMSWLYPVGCLQLIRSTAASNR